MPACAARLVYADRHQVTGRRRTLITPSGERCQLCSLICVWEYVGEGPAPQRCLELVR